SLVCVLMGTVFFFSWSARRMVFLAAFTCIGFALVGGIARSPDVEVGAVVSAASALGVGAVITVAGARLLARMRASLAERQRELEGLSVRLMAAQEEERRRLSRELHDELGQSLTAVNAYLWLMEKDVPEDLVGLRERAAEARRLVSKTLA